MPSVGPDLPPHLQKRKRSLDNEDNGSDSPPAKILAASPPTSTERRILGPAPPPAVPKRVLGPAPPPAPLDERPPLPVDAQDNDSSSDDDDDYGPSLPPAAGSAAAYEAEAERAATAAHEAIRAREQAAKPKREDWMLIPPSDSDWGSRVDPTKLKNRKFASGKGAKAPAEKSGISAIWTETPEEKRKRLEDEVMGRKELSTSSATASSKPRRDDAEAEATARRIKEYNEKNRAKSLYDEHKTAIPREKEDDPSARSFDKEKDMGLGGRIGHVQKKDMLKRAGDFGSRFERGSFL